MSYPITKDVARRLAEFAGRITAPDYQPGKPGEPLTAEELRAKGITTTRAGQPIQAGRVYYAAAPPAVNHKRRLQAAYMQGGWPAVEAYLRPFLTPEGFARQQAATAALAGADEVPVPLGESGTLTSAGGAYPFPILPAVDEDGLQQLRTCEPLATAEPREFTKLCQQWEAAAEAAAAV